MRIFYIIVFAMCFLQFNLTHAQLSVNSSLSATQLANIIANDTTVLISNVTTTCPAGSAGSFSNGNTTNIGLTSGVLLTSGKAINAIGPNNTGNRGYNNGAPGDAGLTTWNDGKLTFDACILEFDIVPTFDTLFVKYVFASEEYPEFANTNYNDIFGFFLDGGSIPDVLNFAWVPGSLPPQEVSVNTINPTVNPIYYINNPTGMPGSTIQYDGFTKRLEATIGVVRGSTYHIRLAVADCSDGIYDTGVFLEANGLGSRTRIPLVLPLELISFQVQKNHNTNSVQWTTSSEINCDFFEIERSLDGKYFSSIAKLKGQGSSKSIKTYRYEDRDPVESNSYYRIKQIDGFGKYFYSKIAAVGNSKTSKLVKLYPLPTKRGSHIMLSYVVVEETSINVKIYDVLGRIVYDTKQKCNAGSNEINITTASFSEGQYFVNIIGDNSFDKAKIIIE